MKKELERRGKNILLSRISYAIKGFFALCFICTLLGGLMPTVNADPANAVIEVKAEVGYKNNYSMEIITPLHIELTNLKAEEIRGDFVFTHHDLYSQPIMHTKAVTIPANQSVQFTILVQGTFNKHTTSLHFYEDNYKKGKELALSGQLELQPRQIGGNANIAIIAEDPDTFNFILLANQNQLNVNTIVLEPDYPIEDANSLSLFNAIVLSDVNTGDWPEVKINAIKQYVLNGGTLLINGGASYIHTAQAFSDIVPVSLNGALTELSSLDSLKSYAGLQETSDFNLPVYKGEVVNGKTIVSEQDVPVLVKSDYGSGHILFTAFDFSTRPFTGWEASTSLFVNFMQQEVSQPNVKTINNYNLFEAIQYFPNLSAPPLGLLLIIFVLYILLITIVLYLILKKYDKREWGWWIIPSVAVITTVVIIVIGSLDKTKNHLHEINLVTQKDGYINTTQNTGIFLANTGRLEVKVSNAKRAMFQQGYSYNPITAGGPSGEYVMEHSPLETKLIWNKNDYWTIRYFNTYQPIQALNEQEGIVASVQQSEQGYQLTITNGTGEKLEHVTYVNGKLTHKIGELEAGQLAQFEIPLPIQVSNWSSYNAYNFPDVFFEYKYDAYEKYKRESSLLRDQADLGMFNIIAFSYGHESDTEVNKSRLEVDRLTMWIADITNEINSVVNDEMFVQGEVVSYDGVNNWFEDNYISVNTSELVFSFTIPQEFQVPHKVFLLEENILGVDGQYHYELYDVQTKSWVPYSSKDELIENYMDANGNILLKLVAPNYMEMNYPNLHLKSEVTK